jgi:hypothetical protein
MVIARSIIIEDFKRELKKYKKNDWLEKLLERSNNKDSWETYNENIFAAIDINK